MVELPITSTIAGVLGLMLLPLTMRISFRRAELGNAKGDLTGVVFGDGDDETLRTRIRAMGNFVEYVPLCLILLAFVELRSAPDWLVWSLGITFVGGRISHALGMLVNYKFPLPRGLGMMATYLLLIVAPGWLFWSIYLA